MECLQDQHRLVGPCAALAGINDALSVVYTSTQKGVRIRSSGLMAVHERQTGPKRIIVVAVGMFGARLCSAALLPMKAERRRGTAQRMHCSIQCRVVLRTRQPPAAAAAAPLASILACPRCFSVPPSLSTRPAAASERAPPGDFPHCRELLPLHHRRVGLCFLFYLQGQQTRQSVVDGPKWRRPPNRALS